MQLRRLEVTNIRSFEAGRLDLGAGTTLLVGDVGAGKSSLLYAVEMALFGVAEVDAAFLVRHGTAHAEVGVTLADADHTYAIRRRFRKVRRRGRETYEPERLTYSEDGRPTAYSATEIRQRVIELLGFPDNPNPHAHSDLWRWAIYVPQERMREILSADPEERLETVRKALGVERYRTAAENAQTLSADLRVSARRRREEAGRMAHWDVEFAEATRESDRLRAERDALAKAVAREEAAVAEARGARQGRDAALARVEADRRELEGLRREDAADAQGLGDVARRQEALAVEADATRREGETLRPVAAERAAARAARTSAEDGVRSRRAELDRRAEVLRDLARAVARLDAAGRRSTEAGERARRLAAHREQAAEVVARLLEQGPTREPPTPTPRSLTEIETGLAQAVADEHAALEAVSRAKASLGQLEELLRAGVCPTCQQPVHAEQFGPHREEAKRAVGQAEASRSARAGERERLEEERKARERYERAHERWVDLERQRTEARGTLAHRDEELRVANEEVAAAGREGAEARRVVDRLRPVEAEESRLREELASAERALHEIAEAEGRATAAEERLRAVDAMADRLASERTRLQTEVATATRRREDRRPRLAALEDAVARAADAVAALEGARAAEATASRRLADAQGSLVRADTRLDGLVERVAAAERGRAERASLLVEAGDLEAKAAWVAEPFRLAVLRMEKELLAHAQAAFDRAFSRFFASLIDDPMLTARTDVSFTPEVTIAGESTPAEALSGGERTGLALAFRLALASVVRSLGEVRLETLLLDEPTDGFSSEQVVRMGELLEELALPQVVVVSHESQLAGVADRTVRVVKVDGRSSLEADRGRETEEGPDAAGEGEPVPTRRRDRSSRPRSS
ncbi:MAG TPA: SMC family ATPase [Thermoplasmata archaeon]|nr:SMC family ATPase [Thermoplasmata archaeon]